MQELTKELEPALRTELIEAFIEDNTYLDFIVKALEGLEND